MRLRSIALFTGLLLIAVLSLFTWRSTTSAAQNEPAAIRLRAVTFTPAAGEMAGLTPGLTIDGFAEGVRGYYIVQFGGPVREEWKARLSAAGGELLYITISNAMMSLNHS